MEAIEAMTRLQTLAARAQAGDRSVLAELRQLLDEATSIWRRLGDLSAHARQAWLDLVAGRDLLLRESLQRKLDDLCAELSGPCPSPLERLVAERVAACWLQLAYADCSYAQARDAPPAALREMQRRQDSAQRRYLAALRQLALVRRLLPAAGPHPPALRVIG